MAHRVVNPQGQRKRGRPPLAEEEKLRRKEAKESRAAERARLQHALSLLRERKRPRRRKSQAAGAKFKVCPSSLDLTGGSGSTHSATRPRLDLSLSCQAVCHVVMHTWGRNVMRDAYSF